MFAFKFELLYYLFKFLGLGLVEISQLELLNEVILRLLTLEFKVAPLFVEKLHLVFKVIELELAGF
jgi:hypothetical protein